MTLAGRCLAAAWTLALALGGGACQSDDVPGKIASPVDQPEPQPQPRSQATEDRLPSQAPAGADEGDMATLQPRRTRGGMLRFSQEEIHDHPAAATVFVRRLATEPRAEVRLALIEALPRTGGDWFDGVLSHLDREADPLVRKAIVAIMIRAEPSRGAAGIARGLRDEAPEVRAEAAFAAGSLPPATVQQRPELLARLHELLAAAHAPSRAAAARSLGLCGFADQSFAALEPLLGDGDAAVRLQALRALGRLDRARAAELPAVRALRADPDTKVSRAAAKLLDR